MSLWIKICGNTSLEDSLIAAEAGADAIGFVFAPSPRRVNITQVRAITEELPATIEKIGVFVDSSCDEVERTVRECRLTGVQLHCAVGSDLTAHLRERLGSAVRILRVVHFGPHAAADAASHDTNVDALLVDSRTASAIGGTGIAFDWDSASALFRGARHPMILAGGLTPENISAAVSKLHPWGVDVVSGVEAERGRKDPERVRAFIAAARSFTSTPCAREHQ
jgi:phosphoribosylanthranilate isomerase